MQELLHDELSMKEMNRKSKLFIYLERKEMKCMNILIINLCIKIKQESKMLNVHLYILHDMDEFQYLDYTKINNYEKNFLFSQENTSGRYETS